MDEDAAHAPASQGHVSPARPPPQPDLHDTVPALPSEPGLLRRRSEADARSRQLPVHLHQPLQELLSPLAQFDEKPVKSAPQLKGQQHLQHGLRHRFGEGQVHGQGEERLSQWQLPQLLWWAAQRDELPGAPQDLRQGLQDLLDTPGPWAPQVFPQPALAQGHPGHAPAGRERAQERRRGGQGERGRVDKGAEHEETLQAEHRQAG